MPNNSDVLRLALEALKDSHELLQGEAGDLYRESAHGEQNAIVIAELEAALTQQAKEPEQVKRKYADVLKKDINACDFGVPEQYREQAENYARYVTSTKAEQDNDLPPLRDADRYNWLNKQDNFLIEIDCKDGTRRYRLKCGEPLDKWIDARIKEERQSHIAPAEQSNGGGA